MEALSADPGVGRADTGVGSAPSDHCGHPWCWQGMGEVDYLPLQIFTEQKDSILRKGIPIIMYTL